MINTLLTGVSFNDPFLEKRYDLPKNLQLNKEELNILNAIASYASNLRRTQVILSAIECEKFNTDKIINERYPEISIIKLENPTKGALVTSIMGLGNFDLSQPVVIAPTDSCYLPNINQYIENFINLEVEAGVLIVKDRDPRWSYVLVDKAMEVKEIKEKQIISEFATIGVFYFKSAHTLLGAARWCLVNNISLNDEFFVSHSINYLIASGKKIGSGLLKRENYYPIKSPSDILAPK
jgi:hypothetical protein